MLTDLDLCVLKLLFSVFISLELHAFHHSPDCCKA